MEGREPTRPFLMGAGQAQDKLDVNTVNPDVHSPPGDKCERAAPPQTFPVCAWLDSTLSEQDRPHKEA